MPFTTSLQGIRLEKNSPFSAIYGGDYTYVKFDRWLFDDATQFAGDWDSVYQVVQGSVVTSVYIKQPGVYSIMGSFKWSTDFDAVKSISVWDGWSSNQFQMERPAPIYLGSNMAQNVSYVQRYPLWNFYPGHAGWPFSQPAVIQVSIGQNSGADKNLDYGYLEIYKLDAY